MRRHFVKIMQPKLTICIPTFNRGAFALNQVQHTLPLIEKDWEILVLDNGSDLSSSEYRQIELMAKSDPRLTYIRHGENKGFPLNFATCFTLSSAPYIQIVTDEDFSNPPVVLEAIKVLQEFSDLGAIRGSIATLSNGTPRNAMNCPDAFLKAGEEALTAFSLTTNYLSGMIYNKALLNSNGVFDRFGNGLGNNPASRIYPHMYLDIFVAAVCDVAFTSETVCFEGPEAPAIQNTQQLADSVPYSFGGRLEQFIGFRDAFREACSKKNIQLLINLYGRLCDKYFHLFHSDRFLHQQRSLNFDRLHESLLSFLLASADIPEFEGHRDVVRIKCEKAFAVSLAYKDASL